MLVGVGLHGLPGEGGVAQAVAEGIEGLHAEGVEIPVAHVDALPVIGLVPLAAVVAERGGRRVVRIGLGPGGRQTARGVGLPQEHVGHGVAAHGAALADQDQGADAGHGPDGRRVHHAAHVQQDDQPLVPPPQLRQQRQLPRQQLIVAGTPEPVRALAGVPGQHIDGRLPRRIRGRREGRDLLRHKGIGPADKHGLLPGAGRFGLHRRPVVLMEPPGQRRLGVQPVLGGDGEARRLQALLHGDREPGVDVAGARAALDRGSGPVAEERHRARLRQRQRAVVLQDHHTLSGQTAHQVQVRPLQGRHGRVGQRVIGCHGRLLTDRRRRRRWAHSGPAPDGPPDPRSSPRRTASPALPS